MQGTCPFEPKQLPWNLINQPETDFRPLWIAGCDDFLDGEWPKRAFACVRIQGFCHHDSSEKKALVATTFCTMQTSPKSCFIIHFMKHIMRASIGYPREVCVSARKSSCISFSYIRPKKSLKGKQFQIFRVIVALKHTALLLHNNLARGHKGGSSH